MCTLIFWYRAIEETPLIVAANRDERIDRPAAPPSVRQLSHRTVLCPTDLQAGGTWLGINDRRVFAAITNRVGSPKHQGRPSRGGIVLQALDQPDADSAAQAIAALEPHRQNAFHLAVADEKSAHLLVCDGSSLTHQRLDPGLHILTERSFGAAETSRDSLIRARLSRLTGAPDDGFLKKLLASHQEQGFPALCVHEGNYGTRSSTILRLDGNIRMLFADGPPHNTPYLEAAVAELNGRG